MFYLIIQGNVLREWKNYALMRSYIDPRSTNHIYVTSVGKDLLDKNKSIGILKCVG